MRSTAQPPLPEDFLPTLSPYYSHLAVATAALGFANSHTLLALEGEPSLLMLEAAIDDAKTALAHMMRAADALEGTRQKAGAAKAPCSELSISLKLG